MAVRHLNCVHRKNITPFFKSARMSINPVKQASPPRHYTTSGLSLLSVSGQENSDNEGNGNFASCY
jgi:hypothetical protein